MSSGRLVCSLVLSEGLSLSNPNISSTHCIIVSCGTDSKAPDMSSAITMGMNSHSLDCEESRSRLSLFMSWMAVISSVIAEKIDFFDA